MSEPLRLDPEARTEGWWFPFNSRKAHYMVDGLSLCGKWLCLGRPELDPEDGKRSKDDCSGCLKKLARRLTTTPTSS